MTSSSVWPTKEIHQLLTRTLPTPTDCGRAELSNTSSTGPFLKVLWGSKGSNAKIFFRTEEAYKEGYGLHHQPVPLCHLCAGHILQSKLCHHQRRSELRKRAGDERRGAGDVRQCHSFCFKKSKFVWASLSRWCTWTPPALTEVWSCRCMSSCIRLGSCTSTIGHWCWQGLG